MLQKEDDYLLYVGENKNEVPNQVLKIFINQFDIVAWKFDITKKLLYPNEKTKKIFGDDFTPKIMPDYAIDHDIYHPESIGVFYKMYKKLFAGATHVSCEGKVKMSDGKYHWLRVKYVSFLNEKRNPHQAIGTYEDITSEKELQERYEQLKNFRNAFTSDAVLAYEVDLDRDCIVKFDKGSLDTNTGVGSSFYAFVQEVADKFVHPDFKNGFCKFLNRDTLITAFKNGKKKLSYEFISNENDIEYRWLRETVRLTQNMVTGHISAFFYVKNIDKEKNEKLVLKKEANCDPLTGLHNRKSFEELVNQHIENNGDETAALIMLDVDDFKKINDTYGHVFGDTVLCLFADKISEIFRSDDLICRMGGDEFVIFLKNITSSAVATKVAQKLCMSMHSWNLAGQNSFKASCSVGIAMYPKHGRDFTSLYEKADKAQYYAKKHGKNHSCMYREEQKPS